MSQTDEYLACYPDDLVCEGDLLGVVEYKCPYSARNITPAEACMIQKDFFYDIVDGEVKSNGNSTITTRFKE